MLMFKVYIEENAFNAPQPVEVSPDAPIADLLPVLVSELHLPEADLFGNRLTYFLRHTADGRVLPDHFSLRSGGIRSGDHLSLESYVDESVPVLAAQAPRAAARSGSFYADQTIADGQAFVVEASNSAPLVLGPTPTQRAFESGPLPAGIPAGQ